VVALRIRFNMKAGCKAGLQDSRACAEECEWESEGENPSKIEGGRWCGESGMERPGWGDGRGLGPWGLCATMALLGHRGLAATMQLSRVARLPEAGMSTVKAFGSEGCNSEKPYTER